MTVSLACAWRPRGETPRFCNIYPQLENVYDTIFVGVPADVNPADLKPVEACAKVTIVTTVNQSWRHEVVQKGLESDAHFIHYVDLDRLIRWVETRPAEWLQIVETIQTVDCLVLGRTDEAFQTHPKAMQDTESIVNLVFSGIFGQEVDFCGGSRGFSRQAANHLMQYGQSDSALGTDTQWPIMLQEAGFTVKYQAVNGLDWESADRYLARAADRETQQQVADAWDKDADHWAFRVRAALEIVQAGLNTTQNTLLEGR